MALSDQIAEQIRGCFDPEIPVNVYDLGLIYNVDVQLPVVTVQMTFTSESCPSAREIPMDIRRKVLSLDGIEAVDFEIVWEPAWHPRMIAEEARKELGIEDEALEV